MLATIRDDTLNVLNMLHITPNSKRWDHSDTHGVPAHMVEIDHHIRKISQPPPTHPHDNAAYLLVLKE